jgi:hypothetical protein
MKMLMSDADARLPSVTPAAATLMLMLRCYVICQR